MRWMVIFYSVNVELKRLRGFSRRTPRTKVGFLDEQ
jgi:hypothetical protein